MPTKVSIEAETLNKYSHKLEGAIVFGVSTLAHKALSQGLITRQQLAKYRHCDEYEQAERFIQDIGSRIESNGADLVVFINILREDVVYRLLAKEISDYWSLKTSTSVSPGVDSVNDLELVQTSPSITSESHLEDHIMSSKSIELSTFDLFTEKIELAIVFGISSLASKALSTGLIDRKQLVKCRQGDEYSQAKTFLSCIRLKIEKDGMALDTFIKNLSDDMVYAKLVTAIEGRLKLEREKSGKETIGDDLPDVPTSSPGHKQSRKEAVKS